MKKSIILLLTATFLIFSSDAKDIEPISIDEFSDLIHHGVMKFPNSTPPYERWSEKDVLEIADNLLTFQNPDGGWGKIGRGKLFEKYPQHKKLSCQDILVKLAPEEKVLIKDFLSTVKPVKFDSIKTEGSTRRSDKIQKPRSVLDNRMTYSHVRYLTKVYNQTGDKKYLDGAIRGLAWIIDVQLPCGGWSGCDVYGLCINDDVTSGVLTFMQDLLNDGEYKTLVDNIDPLTKKPFAEEVKLAHDKAIDILLKTQVTVNGKKTVWAHNYDPDTLKPIAARPFEPAALTALESVNVIQVLLWEKEKSPELIEAIKAATDFLCSDNAFVYGWIEKKQVPGFEEGGRWYNYENIYHPGSKDSPSPENGKLLKRFISIEDFSPLFADWDGIIYKDFNKVPVERRNGYGFLTKYKESDYKYLKLQANSL